MREREREKKKRDRAREKKTEREKKKERERDIERNQLGQHKQLFSIPDRTRGFVRDGWIDRYTDTGTDRQIVSESVNKEML